MLRDLQNRTQEAHVRNDPSETEESKEMRLDNVLSHRQLVRQGYILYFVDMPRLVDLFWMSDNKMRQILILYPYSVAYGTSHTEIKCLMTQGQVYTVLVQLILFNKAQKSRFGAIPE